MCLRTMHACVSRILLALLLSMLLPGTSVTAQSQHTPAASSPTLSHRQHSATSARPADTPFFNLLTSVSGTLSTVAISGTLAYAAEGNGVTAINISNPAHPVSVARQPLDGTVVDLALAGPLIYALTQSSLVVIDIHQPLAPHLRGHYTGFSQAHSLQVIGALAYVADLNYGLIIIDLHNSDMPTVFTTFITPSPPVAFQIANLRLYVATSTTIQVFDLSDPNQLRLLGSYMIAQQSPTESASLIALAVAGTTAYITVQNGMPQNPTYTFETVDLSDPAAAVLQGQVPEYLILRAVSGTHGYALSQGLVLTLDLSNPGNLH